MPWFCAHILQSFRYLEGEQTVFPVWENIVLIEAADSGEAWAKAEAMVKESNKITDDSLRLNDRPARSVCDGVRKIMAVSHDATEGVLTSGDEVTFLDLEFKSVDDIAKYLKGEAVDVALCED